MALFYTIGHSTRLLAELLDILETREIQVLVDVRAIPRSRTNPQFNSDTLPGPLGERGIQYLHLAELGGRRGRQRGVERSPNTFWQNQSFRNFADYAMTEPFQQGLGRLKRLGEAQRCAIMCSETVWWRCHRRIIADYLILAGETVVHIFTRNKEERAKPTPAARPFRDGKIVYDLR
jgi:uncharacterized protein (DUF488 family)